MAQFAERLKKIIRKRVWPNVPEPVRRRIRLFAARRVLGIKNFERVSVPELLERRYNQVVNGTAASVPHGHAIELSTLEHADEMIRCSRLLQQHEGHSSLMAYMSGFRYRFPLPPNDPFSPEYRDFWMAQYLSLIHISEPTRPY